MADGDNDNPGTYPIQGLSALPKMTPKATITPPENSDIFAVKKENLDRLGSIIGIVLGEGVFLCNAYRLDKRVSRNEMGETWKASDIQDSRNVIVYLPPLKIRKDESATESARKNVRRVEALDHPRIVPTLDNFTDPEHGFFTVRKFVNGKTLDVYRQEYVKRHKKFTPLKAVKMLNDLAHALDYAHSVDIVHGGLCPKSIIVGLDGEVYLDNFTLIPVQADKVSPEKRPYLPPEVTEDNVTEERITAVHSDIYSLAVIAYELLSGRLPYSLESMDTPLPIPNVPSAVDAVIRKAMARLPDDRYDSCGAFAKALETSFQESQKIRLVVVPPPSKHSVGKVFAAVMLWTAALVLFGIGFYGFLNFDNVKTALVDTVNKSAGTEPKPVVPVPEPDESPVEPDKPPPEPVAPQPEPDVPLLVSVESSSEQDTFPSESAGEVSDFLQEELDSPAEVGELPQISPAAIEDSLRMEGEQQKLTMNGIEYSFRWCSQGPFMGGFWIQETAVTQELWKAFMDMRDQPADGVRLPVRRVSWNECRQFTERLNDEPAILAKEEFQGYHFALPTEKQWEYAYEKGIFSPHEGVWEWCRDWYDDEKMYHVVRGSNRQGRDPGLSDHVGFRLVIIRRN